MSNLLDKIFSLKGTFLKFALVGISGIAVNQGLLALQVDYLNIDLKIASIVAIELSILNNFLWNNIWTWKERKNTKSGQDFCVIIWLLPFPEELITLPS